MKLLIFSVPLLITSQLVAQTAMTYSGFFATKQSSGEDIQRTISKDHFYKPLKVNGDIPIREPLCDIAFLFGSNFSFPTDVKPFSVYDGKKEYIEKISYQGGVSGTIYIDQNFSFRTMGLLTSKKIQILYPNPSWQNIVDEYLTYIDIPIIVSYYPGNNKRFRPYINTGFFAGYLISSFNNFELVSKKNPSQIINKKVNAIELRNKWNLGFDAGMGIENKIGKGRIFLEVNYYYSLSQVNNPETRFSDLDFVYSYQYVEDDFKLNNFTINLGYGIYIYKSKSANVQTEEPHYVDVIYLKNGSLMKGMIIEQIPNVHIKIQTKDGSVFVYKIEEIEKITKELEK